MTIKIDLIVAARPNFMKVAPLYKALDSQGGWCKPRLVHTGQHYDANMSDAFFRDFGLPDPDIHLGVGSGSHAEQTAGVMLAYEKVCLAERPDVVVVVGDVNSTLACTLVATKLGIQVGHLEAGLRSGDRTMPEELNRLATDALADILWTPSPDADENLRKEGIPESRVERVGNIMIDSLEMMRETIDASRFAGKLGFAAGEYGVMTLHRPSNVDERSQLSAIVEMIKQTARRIPLIFPVHPRTRQRLTTYELLDGLLADDRVCLIEPVGYIDFMNLVFNARFAMTDSGGVQEETTYLGIPCLTLRKNTERPITVTEGTNRLIDVAGVAASVDLILSGDWPKGRKPERWDGKTAGRVVSSLRTRLGQRAIDG
jgi:UDP-N-acetylglucosamine 2-epimerase (non-hydrolysing)